MNNVEEIKKICKSNGVPDYLFKYTTMDCQEFRDCWVLSNLRPLRVDLNFKKSGKILEEDEDE